VRQRLDRPIRGNNEFNGFHYSLSVTEDHCSFSIRVIKRILGFSAQVERFEQNKITNQQLTSNVTILACFLQNRETRITKLTIITSGTVEKLIKSLA